MDKTIILSFILVIIICTLFSGCTTEISEPWQNTSFGTDYQRLDQNITPLNKEISRIIDEKDFEKLDLLYKERMEVIKPVLSKLKGYRMMDKYVEGKNDITSALQNMTIAQPFMHAAKMASEGGDTATAESNYQTAKEIHLRSMNQISAAILNLDKNNP